MKSTEKMPHVQMNAETTIQRSRRGIRLVAVLASVVGFALLPACAEHVVVPAEIVSCPCGTGAICCASGVCAADQSSCAVATSALFEDAQGSWSGYFENFGLASGSDTIQISISVAADGTGSGQVVLGNAEAPSPPTNPDLPWPVTNNVDEVTPTLFPDYVEGFPYEARDLRWESRRLRFTIDRSSAWQSWCALQTPFPLGGSNVPTLYSCAGDITGGGSQACVRHTNPPATVDCYKAIALCGFSGGVCSCDATGCTSADKPTSFDIAIRDGVGDGSTSLSGGHLRLTQTSH